MPHRKEASLRILLKTFMMGADLIIFVGSFILAFVLSNETFGLGDIGWFGTVDQIPEFSAQRDFIWSWMPYPLYTEFSAYLYTILLPLPIVRFMVMMRLECYELQGEISIVEDMVETFRAVTIGTILLIVVAFLNGGGIGEERFVAGRKIFPIDWVLCLIGCISVRLVVRYSQVWARRHGANLTPVILLGRGPTAQMVKGELEKDPVLGYRIVRELGVDGEDPDIAERFQEVPALIEETGAREVLVASRTITQKDLFPILMNTHRDVSFKVVPDLLGLRPKRVCEKPISWPNVGSLG